MKDKRLTKIELLAQLNRMAEDGIIPPHEVIPVKCDLTESEVAAYGREHARLHEEAATLKDNLKNLQAELGAGIKNALSQATARGRIINNGYEYRDATTLVIFRPEDGQKDYYHAETYEWIETRKMTEADFKEAREQQQPSLFKAS